MSITTSEFESIQSLISRTAAVVLQPHRAYQVEARLLPLARGEEISVSELIQRVQSRSANPLQTQVIESLTAGETSFFHDGPTVDALRGIVFPDLAARATGPLRIWSAGCSSGQEPYSLAILLQEYFPALLKDGLQILATDLSLDALERGRAGVYSQIEINRGLTSALVAKAFRRLGLAWQITEELRALVDFRHLNLIEPWPILPAMDVILMRNVLDRFDAAARSAVLEKIRKILPAGGYVVTGDDSFATDAAFDEVADSGCYRRRLA